MKHLLILVALAFFVALTYECGTNEVFQQCGVRWDCGRDGNARVYCEIGCYCRPGYVRSGPEYDAKCIPEEECPEAQPQGPGAFAQNAPLVQAPQSSAYRCRANEEWNDCGVGKQCEDYCGRSANACAYCQPGCYCKKNYIRSGPESNAKCVRKCPSAQDANKSFSQNLGLSKSVLDGSQSSIQDTQGPGYDCRPDEFFDICGVGPECEDYCGGRPNACNYCQPGCYCKEDTIRAGASNTTRCVAKNQCKTAPKCSSNEVYSDCGSACPANCENRDPVCSQKCVSGCFCKKGFIRKYADVQVKRYSCIREEQCSAPIILN